MEEILDFIIQELGPGFIVVVGVTFLYVSFAAFFRFRNWRESKKLKPTPRPNRKPYDEGSFRK